MIKFFRIKDVQAFYLTVYSLSFAANTSNGNLISTKLLNGNASRLLIDTFKAGAIRYEIDRPQISLEEVKEVQASYGIILSGELKRASKCIKKYIDENSDEFMKKLGDATFSSEVRFSMIISILQHVMIFLDFSNAE